MSHRLGIGLVILCACKANGDVAPARTDRWAPESLFRSPTTAEMSLVVVPLRDTFHVGGPVDVVYFVRNGTKRTPFRNDPLFYYFRLVAPTGQAMQPSAGREPGSLGSVPDVVLPADAILGRVIDLSCVRPPFAEASVPQGQCAWKYTFTEPGRYQLVAWYQPVSPPLGSHSVAPTLRLESDTVAFVITSR